MQIEKLLEGNKEKDIVEILKILAWQQVITSQGATYTGEKDWALNKILDWHKQSLKQFIDGLVEREEKKFQDEHPVDCIDGVTPVETYGYEATYNEAKKETISHLKEIIKQLK